MDPNGSERIREPRKTCEPLEKISENFEKLCADGHSLDYQAKEINKLNIEVDSTTNDLVNSETGKIINTGSALLDIDIVEIKNKNTTKNDK